jgi:hypothetical protein
LGRGGRRRGGERRGDVETRAGAKERGEDIQWKMERDGSCMIEKERKKKYAGLWDGRTDRQA